MEKNLQRVIFMHDYTGLWFSASWPFCTRRTAPRPSTTACAGLVLLVTIAPCVMFPSGVAKQRMLCILAGMDQMDSYVAPKLQFVKVVVIPVVSQRLIPMVQPVWRTKEISQLQFALGWSMSLVCKSCRFFQFRSCSSSTWSSSPLSWRG